LSKVDRERIKQASKELLAGVLAVIAPLDHWTEKEQTQAEVETFILDHVYQTLPEPPYTPDDKAQVAQLVYRISGSRVCVIKVRMAHRVDNASA
jgi:type I restriction enzyme R subunit